MKILAIQLRIENIITYILREQLSLKRWASFLPRPVVFFCDRRFYEVTSMFFDLSFSSLLKIKD